MFIDEWCRDARGWRSLHQFKVGVGHDEPFRAGRLEINLHPRMCSAAFVVEDDALPELAVADALPQPDVVGAFFREAGGIVTEAAAMAGLLAVHGPRYADTGAHFLQQFRRHLRNETRGLAIQLSS